MSTKAEVFSSFLRYDLVRGLTLQPNVTAALERAAYRRSLVVKQLSTKEKAWRKYQLNKVSRTKVPEGKPQLRFSLR